jgi:hypothetical protein
MDEIIASATQSSMIDFKGVPIRNRLVARAGQTKSTYTVVNVRQNRVVAPFLLCFTPVPSSGIGMLVLATRVDNIVLSRLQTEMGMAENIRKRIDDLELRSGVSVAVLSSDGTEIASKGLPITIDRIPEKARKKVN